MTIFNNALLYKLINKICNSQKAITKNKNENKNFIYILN